MKKNWKSMLAMLLVAALMLPGMTAFAENEDSGIEYVETILEDTDEALQDDGAEPVEEVAEFDLVDESEMAEGDEDTGAEDEPVPYFVYHMMLKRDPEEPDVLIADPQTLYAQSGEVIEAAEVALPDAIYPQYQGLPFVQAEEQLQDEMLVDEENTNCLTIYYTLPLTLTVENCEAVFDGGEQQGATEFEAEGQLPDVPLNVHYEPACGTEPGVYEGSFDLTGLPAWYAPVMAVPGQLTILVPEQQTEEEADEVTVEEESETAVEEDSEPATDEESVAEEVEPAAEEDAESVAEEEIKNYAEEAIEDEQQLADKQQSVDELLPEDEQLEDEHQPKEQSKEQTDEQQHIENLSEGNVEDYAEKTQPIAVAFDVTPESAVVTVYPADTEETLEPEAIPAQEDGTWLLLPGEYTYSASADGCVSAEFLPFTVEASEEPITIYIVLESLEEDPVPFNQSKTINGVTVTVQADLGVFPADAELQVSRVPVNKRHEAENAIEEVRDEDVNVAISYTFDIKVVDPETGEEYQPAEGQTVNVSFALAEAADGNLETQVYHVTEDAGEMTAEVLDTDVNAATETVTATTDGFSLYTVEFTYSDLEYVLPGDTSVSMSEILSTLGLSGEVTEVEISDTSLFSASNEKGEWIITAHQAFRTTEWMKATINGVKYEITVTDAVATLIQPSADSRIFIFDQSGSGEHSQGNDITITHNDDPNRTMRQYGCSLYATMHAYQWVTGDKRNVANAAALITQFKSQSPIVKDYQNGYVYSTYLHNSFGVILENPNMDESSLISFFNKGGALKTYTPNKLHYFVAVGAVKADIDSNGSSETWIHIVDSAAYYTFDPKYSNIPTNCYTFTSHTPLNRSFLNERNAYGFTNNRSEDNYAALEYWMPYTVFKNCSIVAGYLPSKSQGSTFFSADLVFAENCTYRVVKGFNWRNSPSSTAETVGWASAGSTFVSDGVYRNSANNMWVKLKGQNKYVFAGYKWDGSKWNYDPSQTQYLQFVSDNGATVSWPGCNAGGAHPKASLTLQGSINCTSTIATVQGEFFRGNSCWGNPTSKFSVNSDYYSMPNSPLDHALPFASLPVDNNLTLRITVEYYYNRGQSKGVKYIDTAFSIVNGGGSSGGSGSSSGGSTIASYKVITNEGLNVRYGAGTGYGIITTIWPDTTINITETTVVNGTTWGKGTTSTGVTGWISLSSSLVQQVSGGTETQPIAYLDLNGWFNGVETGDLGNRGTADVYINGTLVANDTADFYSEYPVGVTYEIKDIRAQNGYSYEGVQSGSLSGTVGSPTTRIVLRFEDLVDPTVSNVQVSGITDEGYTITCTVSDNVGVTSIFFPTWYEGQQGEDAIWHRGTVSGNTATCYIQTSDHNDQTGLNYHTDVYAYDAVGRCGTASARNNWVPERITGINIKCYQSTTAITGTQIEDNVVWSPMNLVVGDQLQFVVTNWPAEETINNGIWSTSNSSIVSVNAGKIIAKAPGTAKVSVKTADGQFEDSLTINVADGPQFIEFSVRAGVEGEDTTFRWNRISGTKFYHCYLYDEYGNMITYSIKGASWPFGEHSLDYGFYNAWVEAELFDGSRIESEHVFFGVASTDGNLFHEDRIYKYADKDEYVYLPDNLRYIESEALYGNSSMTTLRVPSSYKSIGRAAFANCSNLESVIFDGYSDGNLETIGEGAFSGCSKLDYIRLPETVTEIKSDTFKGCTGLVGATLSDNLTTIGERAFYGCENLDRIIIPASVTYIADNAFYGCENLTIQAECGSYAEKWARRNNISLYVKHSSIDSAAVSATCTKTGLSAGRKCKNCGTILSGCETIPAKGHTPVTVKGKASTCTTTGLTDGSKCSVCGTVIATQQTIAKKAHTPVTVKGKAATCTATGLTDGTKCSVCGTTLTAQKTIAKTAHKPVTVKGKAATCTATGLTDGTKCSACGTWIKAQQTIAKKAHTPTTVKGYAATYVKAGLSDGTKCSVCGTTLKAQTAIARKTYPGSVLAKKGKNGTITVNLGEQFLLTPAFATSAGLTVKGYKSSKKKVAVVDGSGIVTAKAEGKATITVKTNNKKKKATVVVKVVDPYKPTGISITNGKKVTLEMGKTLKLGTKLKPETEQTTKTIKSPKNSVATVNGSGLVMPHKEGTAKITVTTRNKKKATITVKVVDPFKPTGISITNGKTVTIKAGQTLKLGTKLKPGSARSALTWKSNKVAIATVDSSGTVTAVKKGTAKITVTTYNKKKTTITIKVVD